jgi:hypothetical protein
MIASRTKHAVRLTSHIIKPSTVVFDNSGSPGRCFGVRFPAFFAFSKASSGDMVALTLEK